MKKGSEHSRALRTNDVLNEFSNTGMRLGGERSLAEPNGIGNGFAI